ncbi:MAG: response regulator transcription factor [Clostridia bacterium]|nr:response regulator transcription factor [Clostridia bacterium]MBR3815421.1 response regulator transcription factor [Clostridia bacterium]MBR3920282.1 response regulator transcription factor [Clostridia bacterium]
MKFVVCDDDEIFLNGFKSELLKADNSLDVACFDNSKQTLEYLKTEHNNTDAAFIDIRLSDSSGIDLAQQLSNNYPDIKLIFITGFGNEYFEEIFLTVRPFAILQKPIKKDYLLKHINGIKTAEDINQQKLIIKVNRSELSLAFDKIIYIESDKRKAHIYTKDDVFTVYEKLDDIQRRLDESFIRCQKSFIVNLCHISSLESNNFVMTDNKKISISPSKRTDVKTKYMEFNFNLLNKTGV